MIQCYVRHLHYIPAVERADDVSDRIYSQECLTTIPYKRSGWSHIKRIVSKCIFTVRNKTSGVKLKHVAINGVLHVLTDCKSKNTLAHNLKILECSISYNQNRIRQ